jgi:hypothetical protein
MRPKKAIFILLFRRQLPILKTGEDNFGGIFPKLVSYLQSI